MFNVNIFLIANRKASHYKNYRCETVLYFEWQLLEDDGLTSPVALAQ